MDNHRRRCHVSRSAGASLIPCSSPAASSLCGPSARRPRAGWSATAPSTSGWRRPRPACSGCCRRSRRRGWPWAARGSRSASSAPWPARPAGPSAPPAGRARSRSPGTPRRAAARGSPRRAAAAPKTRRRPASGAGSGGRRWERAPSGAAPLPPSAPPPAPPPPPRAPRPPAARCRCPPATPRWPSAAGAAGAPDSPPAELGMSAGRTACKGGRRQRRPRDPQAGSQSKTTMQSTSAPLPHQG
mmetsp:Transcript_10085/g.24050  ORF Transcript_10085/g.24050 Transcript_10085/m.24050 type:complete len:243 (-) Transcript_10085:132-860(-)